MYHIGWTDLITTQRIFIVRTPAVIIPTQISLSVQMWMPQILILSTFSPVRIVLDRMALFLNLAIIKHHGDMSWMVLIILTMSSVMVPVVYCSALFIMEKISKHL